MARTAFIGLGVMGAPMAGHLAAAGHEVAVYNRSEDKARDWAQKHKGRTYSSVANAAEGADIVFSCVGNDRDLREVFEAAASKMRKGAIFVDHTTASATIARELAEKAEASGFGFLDAPVSGGQAGAELLVHKFQLQTVTVRSVVKVERLFDLVQRKAHALAAQDQGQPRPVASAIMTGQAFTARGEQLDVPSDPLGDPTFVRTLRDAYVRYPTTSS